MSRRLRLLVFGTGGWAGVWHEHFLPSVADQAVVAALVDQDAASLHRRGDELGVPPQLRCESITAAATMLKNEPPLDAALVVVPPACHLPAITVAAEAGLPVLTEKPLAGTWQDAVDITRLVRSLGTKLQVVQNYRHYPAIAAAKSVLADGRLGPVLLVSARFGADYRAPGSWGGDRHRHPHAALVEAGAHHFDQIRNLAGETPELVWADEWRPARATSFTGSPCAVAGGVFPSSARFVYEASAVAAGQQSGWKEERYRIECAQGSLTVDGSRVVVAQRVHGETREEEVRVEEARLTGHRAVLREFLAWVADGTPPSTPLDDNVKTAATMFAAVQAAQRRSPVTVAAHLAQLI